MNGLVGYELLAWNFVICLQCYARRAENDQCARQFDGNVYSWNHSNADTTCCDCGKFISTKTSRRMRSVGRLLVKVVCFLENIGYLKKGEIYINYAGRVEEAE